MKTTLPPPSVELSPEEIARYSRHVILPQVGLEGQKKLAAARVLLIGMGGLGSPASLYLAAAGVGTLGLAEMDKLEAHNLQRQILHSTEMVGAPKIDSARARLSGLNPHIDIREHPQGVTIGNAFDLFSSYDLILDGSDNFPTRYLVNDAAFLTRKPLVYGSIFQFEGQLSLFHPAGGGPCYRCLFPHMPEPGSIPNCEEAGVFGALCGVVGSLQAMEAIKFLLGFEQNLMGRLLVIESLAMRFRTLRLNKEPACPLCGTHPSILKLSEENYEFSCRTEEGEIPPGGEENEDGGHPIEVGVEEAKKWLDSENPPYLLDVREGFETEVCQISGSNHIPMREVPAMIDALPRDRSILIYCHHGQRSLMVARFLREKGLQKAASMAGGIHSWADLCEPQMTRY